MRLESNLRAECAMYCNRVWPCRLLLAVLAISSTCFVAGFVAPRSECYTMDDHNYLYDFTDWIGRKFPFDDQEGSNYVLRFCKDVQQLQAAQKIVNYGRYAPAYSSATSDSLTSFVQEYRFGDLKDCEREGYDFSGRSTTVSIICGTCPRPSTCKDPDFCICSVTTSTSTSKCLLNVVMAVKCVNRGPLVFSGFAVGFSPRGKEVVENGITQWGYEFIHTDYSFVTQQSRVVLYFSALSTLASKIGKPSYKVYPEKGLKIQLSGTAAIALAPTTESPTTLEIDWRCEKAATTPYLVNVTVPLGEYDPAVFTLGKHCEFKQEVEKTGSNGWATFGVLSCIFIVGLTMFCCAGFLYKSRVEDKHGLDALPGFGAFTSVIEAASGDRNGYAPADDASNPDPSRNGSLAGARGLQRGSDSTSYGAV